MLNTDQLARDIAAKKAEGEALLAKTCKTAEDENRAMTEDEVAAIKKISDEGIAMQTRLDRAKGTASLSAELGRLYGAGGSHLTPATPRQVVQLSMGQQFVTAPEYDFFKKQMHRTSASWRSPSLELFDGGSYRSLPGMFAATLTEDPASGGALVLPDYQPGILPLMTKRLVVADLLASGTTDSNAVSYMQEKLFTNAAAAVAEGAAKPESTITFEAITDPVRKIAHWLPVTEEMLEDVAQIRSYIDARLRLGVQIAEEDELLNGSGVAPHILGLKNRVGLAVDVVRAAAESNADAIFRQIMAIFGSSFLMPDGVAMNPADWTTTVLTKTAQGNYLTGGPFSPIQVPTLWGLPVAVTPSQAVTIAFVGAYKQAAQVFRKGGIRVEASNSHQDFFVKNLVAIRAEERLALAVYRPGAFGEVTGLGAPA
jgi:HK97 family phage major capsid protein